MCEVITYKKPRRISAYQRQQRYDPTRTLTIRDRFAREMRVRSRALVSVIMESIDDNDCFGLKPETYTRPQTNMAAASRRQFDFPTTQGKVEAFMTWLRTQQEEGILTTTRIMQQGQAIDAAWTNMYVQDTYERGVLRARAELVRGGFNVPSIEQTGGIQASMSTPFHMDRLGVLYTRTFNELKGVSEAMDQQISRVLTEGMMEGNNPRVLAKKMNKVITGRGEMLGIQDSLGRWIPASRRAEMIARTETIRAHHRAMIQEYRNWEVHKVYVKAEWKTAGDERMCGDCAGLHNERFTLDVIEGMIPYHPNCRCIAIPVRRDQNQRGR